MLGDRSNRDDRKVLPVLDDALEERSAVVDRYDDVTARRDGPCIEPLGTTDIDDNAPGWKRLEPVIEFGEFFGVRESAPTEQAQRTNAPDTFVELRRRRDDIAQLGKRPRGLSRADGVPDSV